MTTLPNRHIEPTPDFLRDALLAELAQPTHAELTELLLSALSMEDGQDGAGVLRRLTRAAALFATVAPLVGEIVHHQPTLLAAAIESLVLTGLAARVVEQHLVEAITLDMFIAHETERLLDLLGPDSVRPFAGRPPTACRTACLESPR